MPKNKQESHALQPVQINWDSKWRDYLARKQATRESATAQCSGEILGKWDAKYLKWFEQKAPETLSDKEIDDFLDSRYKHIGRHLKACLKDKGVND